VARACIGAAVALIDAMTAHPNRSPRWRRYFILCERDKRLAPWSVQFGAYEFDDVLAERRDRLNHGVRARNLLIKRCTDHRADIDGVLTKLNAARNGA
jgi:hypothetical protein